MTVMASTLVEKIWNDHVVRSTAGEPDLLYIDLQLAHEVTSPQAFEGLRLANRRVRHPELTVATEDHNIPTTNVFKPIADPVSRTQVETLRANCAEFGVPIHSMGDRCLLYTSSRSRPRASWVCGPARRLPSA